jgi:predicted house-cleaning noncanonical NTP pyrophosphatase (MazG superfamily)
MKKYYHNKLVRDKIPEIIISRGGSYKTKKVPPKSMADLLKKKLVEESKEIINAPKDEILGELSDVLQILVSISEFEKIKFSDVRMKMIEKEKANGAFKKGIFLVWSDKPKGHGDKLDKKRLKK